MNQIPKEFTEFVEHIKKYSIPELSAIRSLALEKEEWLISSICYSRIEDINVEQINKENKERTAKK